jgi:hypothetical protein
MPDGAADAADDIARLRARLWEAGYRPVALYSNDKRPIGGAWQARARRDPPEAAAGTARPDALNTGVLCDGLRAIDLDVDDAALAERLEAMAVGVFGPAPVRWRTTAAGGCWSTARPKASRRSAASSARAARWRCWGADSSSTHTGCTRPAPRCGGARSR